MTTLRNPTKKNYKVTSIQCGDAERLTNGISAEEIDGVIARRNERAKAFCYEKSRAKARKELIKMVMIYAISVFNCCFLLWCSY